MNELCTTKQPLIRKGQSVNTLPSWDGFPSPPASRSPAVREEWARKRGSSQRGQVSERCGLPQIRVSWCHRLDGRMLSTFSMTKFKGANKVLRKAFAKTPMSSGN